MFHALHADQRVGDLPNLRGISLHDQHFKTVIVVEMHVHAGHDVPLEVVLDMRELPREVTHMMVVDERDRRDRFLVLVPFLTDKIVADQVAQRFGSVGVLPALDIRSKSSKR